MKHSVHIKRISCILAIVMVATALVCIIPALQVSAADNIVITLDPGHGGSDPGAVPYGGIAWSGAR